MNADAQTAEYARRNKRAAIVLVAIFATLFGIMAVCPDRRPKEAVPAPAPAKRYFAAGELPAARTEEALAELTRLAKLGETAQATMYLARAGDTFRYFPKNTELVNVQQLWNCCRVTVKGEDSQWFVPCAEVCFRD